MCEHDSPTLKRYVKVPRTFFEDHAKRGCVEYSGNRADYVKAENKKSFTLFLDLRDVQELMSDAEYYGSKHGSERQDFASICNSATRTVAALLRCGVERQHPHWTVK